MAQELDEMLDEIRDLTYALGDLGTTVKSVNANMMAGLDKTAKATKRQTQTIEEFTKQQVKANKSIKDQNENIEKATKARGSETENIRRTVYERQREHRGMSGLIDELGRGTSQSALLRSQFENLGGTSMVATVQLKAVTAGLEGVWNATKLMTAALYRGERGAIVSAKAFSALVQPMADLATTVGTMITVLSLFGPAGLIGRGLKIFGFVLGGLGLAAKTAAKYNELAATQADATFKSFRELSKIGGATASGMDGVFEFMQTLGMSVAEIEEFTTLIQQNGVSLARMGATAADGAKRFAEVAGGLYKGNLGRELEMLGMSSKEQRESTMIYMGILARTGQLQLRNTQQLIQESAKFAKELDLAARLTGQTREEQAKAREAALAESRYRSALVAAEARGDQAEIQRLMRAGTLAAAFKAAGDQEAFIGALQIAAGRGVLGSPEAIATEMTYGFSQVMNDPNMSMTEAMTIVAQNAKRNTEALADVTAVTGEIKTLQTNIPATVDFYQRFQALLDAQRKSGIPLEKFMETQQAQAILGNKNTGSMVDAGRTQQAAALTMDAVVNSFNGAAQLNKAASETFATAVNAFSRTVGAKPVPGGVPGTGTAGAAAAAPAAVTGGNRMGQAAARKRGATPGGAAATLQGLRLKSSEAVGGGESDTRIIALAHELQRQFGGDLKYFSALNDTYERGGNSKHAKGLALDFTLRDSKYSAGSAELARTILAQSGLQGRVIDEYLNPSRSATGGHIHVELEGYKMGGIATGPKSGYPRILHGTEAIVPLPDGRNIPVSMPDFKDGFAQQIGLLGVQITKMDELVSVMRDQNIISNRILQASQS